MASAVLHRDLRSTPPVAVRGEGCYLYDAAGRPYLDASGGAAVSCLGHSHPAIIAAIEAQLRRLPFSHTGFFTNEAAEELAARLIAAAPAGFGAGRVAFVGGGSEAMEAALKLARQHFVERGETSRHRFVARRMSYHGNTLGALAIGGHAGRRAPYAPMLMEVAHVSPCFAYRFRAEGEMDAAYAARLAEELDTTIRRLGPETVAGFVAEPVVGATIGCVPPVPGYFRAVREVCDRHGVLLIADEVMCGMGRTGSLFAMEQEGVAPDLITVAKGLGAGYQPIGALLASERAVAPLLAGSGALQHGHTYMSHAIACAGSLAVLRKMEEEQLLGAVRQRGSDLEAALRARFGDHPHVGDIRGRGLFWAIELVEDRATKRPFPKAAALAARFKAAAQANGLICYPSNGTADGESGDHVLIAPPYIVTPDQIAEIVDGLDTTLSQVLPAARLAA